MYSSQAAGERRAAEPPGPSRPQLHEIRQEATMAESGFSESAEKAVEAVTDGVTAAREKFQRLGDDVQDRYRKASKEVRRSAERARKELRRSADSARETYRDTADKVQKGYRRARKDLDRVGRDVGEYVRENPGKSVLIAAGIGFLVGLIVRRRDNDDD
jgi:ElaB/YqjD/DUF883 family membrane-anchored ribosome-binding protein